MILPDLITRWEELIDKYRKQLDNYGYLDDVIVHSYSKFVNFLKRKPELWMFIPCGKDGLPLEKPNLQAGFLPSEMDILIKEYQEAEARCLFSGFEIITYCNTKAIGFNLGLLDREEKPMYMNVFWFPLTTKTWTLSHDINTIEDLCNKVELTPEGEKQAGI